VAISIRSSNFGWARPNRVVSQAAFQKIAAGHPKFGSERSSPWEFSALTASRLDAPRVPKNPKGKRFSWPHRRAAHTGHTHRMSDPGGPAGPAVPPPAPPAPRASEFTAPGRRAGLPNELHPKFELAESTAVPKIRKIRPKFELTSQSVVIKKARPKL
jgi:hypothetical protein